MRQFIKVALFAMMLIQLSFALVTASAQDSTIIKKLDQLKKTIDSFSKKDETQIVGSLTLQASPVPHYFTDPQTGYRIEANTKLKIKRISFLLKDGYMVDVHVYTDKKTFTNTRAPIALSARRLEKVEDYLQNDDDDYETVMFQELVEHDSLNSFFAKDGWYELTTENNHVTLFRQVGVNTVIDLRIYTDALGLLGSESNGLIQTDARMKLFIHQGNLPNWGTFLAHYLKFNFNAGKFDSKKKYVDVTEFSRTALLQKSYFNGEVALNLIDKWLNYKSLSSLYLDGGVGIGFTKLARDKDTSSVLTNNFFLETGLNLRSSDNIGGDLFVRMMDCFSPSTPEVNGNTAVLFFRIGGEVYYNPLADKANRIFARFNYTISTIQADKRNHYFQFQFGYSVLLSSLLKK